MVEEADLKQWRDAGHVARRTIEGIKGEITAGKSWSEVIDSAERFIRRHGGHAAFPVTISVNEMAAHYTTNTELKPPEGFEGEMIFQKGDLVKLDVGVHIKGAIADNALTVEVGGGGNYTEQIRAAEEARDAAIEKMHPGTPWHEIGASAEQVAKDAGLSRYATSAGISSSDGTCTLELRFRRMHVVRKTPVSREVLRWAASTQSSPSTPLGSQAWWRMSLLPPPPTF